MFVGGDGVIREVSTTLQQLTAVVSLSNARQISSMGSKHDGAPVLCHSIASFVPP